VILSDTAIKNRTTVGVLIVLIFVAGTMSYLTLARESFPDVPIPLVLISTSYEGVSPADVESQVTMKIEKELTGLKGLKEVRSSSAEGLSLITVEFDPDIKIEDALQRVRDKVDLAKVELPTDVEEPVIKEINVAEFPIMMVNISGTISPVRLKVIAEQLEDVIEAKVPGVLDVEVLGALEREIRLEIDQDRVAAYGLTIPEIIQLIPSENVNVSAGGLETPGVKFNVRVPAEFVRPEEVDSLVLAVRDGRPIYLTDVGEVRDTFKDRVSFARLDGVESITISIRKRIGANIVVIAKAVKAILAEAEKRVPQGVKFEITMDQSKDIRLMVADLENNMLSGLILVVLVLVLFLGWRTSGIVAFAIPMSMLMSLAILQLLGYTLNMIVLFSLILALGMLVDNAIVIVENIYRFMQTGYGRLRAAIEGAREVAWPVITSTATTVAAFSPMLFWPGVVGDFMKYLPITLIVTLGCSLFTALVISPTVCSVLAGTGRRTDPDRHHPFVGRYRRLLALALNNRAVTLGLAGLLLAGLAISYKKWGRGRVFFPDFDARYGVINIRSPQGTNIHQSDQLARDAEQRVAPYRADLTHVVANVGAGGEGMTFGGTTAGPHVANVTLVFHDYNDRKRPSPRALEEIRGAVGDLAGAEIKVEAERHGPPIEADVAIRVIGEDFNKLQEISREVLKAVQDVHGLINVRSDHEAARPEIPFLVDRRRAMLTGVNTAVVGYFLQTAIFGREVGKFRQFNDEYDITVRLPLRQRTHIDDLFRLNVPSVAGDSVPLLNVGSFDYRGGFGTIHRIDQKRVITITGDAEGRLSEEVLRDVQTRLAHLDLPVGYEIRYAGEKEEMEKAFRFLFTRALPIALLVIVMILVAQFNTLSVPLIIMTTVFLSFIGVLTGLLSTSMPFSVMMTGIGVLSLAGVVVNNAIVLLDYTRRLQRRGMELVAAAIQAGATRLRPVLLTAATTILSLVPMATGVSFDFHRMAVATRSESSQWWASMAVAVIFGLAFATILTLVVVPTLYVSLYRLAARLNLGGLRRPAEQAAAEQPELEDF